MADLSGDVLAQFPRDKIVVIDTETTGLDPETNEILSLAVVDIDGNELFYHLIRPHTRKRWPKAQEIHGIRWADVKDEKPLTDYANELAPLFAPDNLIVGYNVWFDIDMIRASLGVIPADNTFDVMKEFANFHIEGGRYRKLGQAAQFYGYKFKAHNALEDAKATAYIFGKLVSNENYIQECKEKREEQERLAELYLKEQKKQAASAAAKMIVPTTVKLVIWLIVLAIVVVILFTMCSR